MEPSSIKDQEAPVYKEHGQPSPEAGLAFPDFSTRLHPPSPDRPPELPASAHFLPGDSGTDLLMLCIAVYVTMETHALWPLLALPSPCPDLALHSFLSPMPLPHYSLSQYPESPANPVAHSFWCLLAWQKPNSGEIQVFA